MNDGRALIIRANGLRLPLRDGSVDTIITSPPYFALRAYSAGPGEIGSEPTPQLFLEALWAATAEMARVLKPSGSIFVNLGDKYVGYTNGQGKGRDLGRSERGIAMVPDGPVSAPTVYGLPNKSLMLLPERYRIGCVDRLGLICRSVIVWDKPNGLPESVTDRVRRSHEDWVHLTKGPRYYSATDEIREVAAYPQGETLEERRARGEPTRNRALDTSGFNHRRFAANPLGKLPGSVWTIPSEPLTLPGYFTFEDGRLLDFLAPERGGPRPRTNGHHPGLFDPDPYAEVMASGDAGAWRWMRATGVTSSPWPQTDTGLQLRTAASHYAAFPSRWPEQLIKGFSPPGICLECGQGRVPVVEREKVKSPVHAEGSIVGNRDGGPDERGWDGLPRFNMAATILGYACSCTPHTDHPGSGPDGRPDQVGGALAADGYVRPGPETTAGRAAWQGGPTSLAYKPRIGPWREYHLDRWTPPPTRPAVILDPFSGTGTTPMVARALGRIGVGVDLSHAYCRAARWRVRHDGAKAISRTNLERQTTLL